MTTKKEFMSRPKIASLPLAQREARWKQHKQSPTGRKTVPQKGKGRVTNVRTKSAPVSVSRTLRNAGPRMRGNESSVLVCNKEYFTDVNGYAAFSKGLFVVNAGNPTMFPWLSKVATNYESYRFKKLSFHYEPLVATSSPGAVYLVMEFNVNDKAPSSKLELMAYADAMRGSVWAPMVYKPKHSDFNRRKSYYVDDNAEPATLPLEGGGAENLDDVGVLILAVVGATPASTIGELYVEYEVELLTPQFDTDPAGETFATTTSHIGSAPFLAEKTTFGERYLRTGEDGLSLYANLPGSYLITVRFTATSGFVDGSTTLWSAEDSTITHQHTLCDATADVCITFVSVTFPSQNSHISLIPATLTTFGFDAVMVNWEMDVGVYGYQTS